MVIIFTFNFKIIQIVSIVSFFQTIMTIFPTSFLVAIYRVRCFILFCILRINRSLGAVMLMTLLRSSIVNIS